MSTAGDHGRRLRPFDRIGVRFVVAMLAVLGVAVIMIAIAAQSMFINEHDQRLLMWVLVPAVLGAAIVAVLVLALFPQKPTRYLLPNVPLFTFAVAPAAAHYALYAGRIGAFGQASLRVLGVLGVLGHVFLVLGVLGLLAHDSLSERHHETEVSAVQCGSAGYAVEC